jgi:transcriptional regulator with XRE-family HTH domain
MRKQDPPMSQARFARMLGVARQTITNWLESSNRPSEAYLALISQKTGLAMEMLLDALNGQSLDDLLAYVTAHLNELAENDKKRNEIQNLIAYARGIDWSIGHNVYWHHLLKLVLGQDKDNRDLAYDMFFVLAASRRDPNVTTTESDDVLFVNGTARLDLRA